MSTVSRRTLHRKTYDEVVASREGSSLVGTEIIEIVRLTSEGGVDMVDERLCDIRDLCRR